MKCTECGSCYAVDDDVNNKTRLRRYEQYVARHKNNIKMVSNKSDKVQIL